MSSKARSSAFSSWGLATITSSVGSTSRPFARGSLRVTTRTRNPRATACSAMDWPTKPVPPMMQTLPMSMDARLQGMLAATAGSDALPGTVPRSSRIPTVLPVRRWR